MLSTKMFSNARAGWSPGQLHFGSSLGKYCVCASKHEQLKRILKCKHPEGSDVAISLATGLTTPRRALGTRRCWTNCVPLRKSGNCKIMSDFICSQTSQRPGKTAMVRNKREPVSKACDSEHPHGSLRCLFFLGCQQRKGITQ